MKRKKSRFVQWGEYIGAIIVAAPFYLLPHGFGLRAGEQLGELMYRLMSRRRAIGMKNLDIAFGNTLSEEEKHRILHTTFRNLGKSLIEVLHFPKMSKADLQEKVTIVGQEHYLAAMNKGYGVIFLTAHVGNWEMSSHVQSAAGYPLNIVVRPLDNQSLNKLIAQRRTMYGNKLLARRNGLKDIITVLKRKEAVGILMDQNTSRKKGIFVDFFDKPACTIPVIAILALRYNVPVIPGFIVRTGFDTHTLYFRKEVVLERTDDARRDIEVNTAKFNKIIEDFIRQYPDQWFWIHNRWKNQPRHNS